MLTFKLTMNKLTNKERFATTEKSPIFQSHKSCSNSLPASYEKRNQISFNYNNLRITF